MSFVTHAEQKNAIAFKAQVEEVMAEKVVRVLDALKIEIAQSFFNPETVSEEGGVSGGVGKVVKKPGTPKPVKNLVHTGRGGGGSITHAGRSSSSDGATSGDACLPGKTNEVFQAELEALDQKLIESNIVPGSVEHMSHHVHTVHTGDLGTGMIGSGNHYRSHHYHIHNTGVELATNSKGGSTPTHIYHVINNLNGEVHKFHVRSKSGARTGAHSVEHKGMVSK